MKCPVCTVDLRMTDRQGIEIDYCPQCRGVWLDRGELDKLIERSTIAEPVREDPRVRGGQERGDYRGHRDDDYRYEDRGRRGDDYYRHKKKKSFWREVFDFD